MTTHASRSRHAHVRTLLQLKHPASSHRLQIRIRTRLPHTLLYFIPLDHLVTLQVIGDPLSSSTVGGAILEDKATAIGIVRA